MRSSTVLLLVVGVVVAAAAAVALADSDNVDVDADRDAEAGYRIAAKKRRKKAPLCYATVWYPHRKMVDGRPTLRQSKRERTVVVAVAAATKRASSFVGARLLQVTPLVDLASCPN